MQDDKEIILSGAIIFGEEFETLDGYLCIKSGIITEIGQGPVDAPYEGIICPCFVNAHTHVGDSVIKDPPFALLSELVGPGGIKHRHLANAPRDVIVEGMQRSLLDMLATGTCAFADFRESGDAGVEMLLEALQDMPLISRILGRPLPPDIEVHEMCWGLGISSTRDYPADWTMDTVTAARKSKKKVAFHAGEIDRDDIEDALWLKPDFLVHLAKASPEDLGKIAKAGIPVVVCPRSNLVLGAGLPDIDRMLDLGINVGMGTDNLMLNSANIFSEMKLISKYLQADDRQVFKMCTLNGARILGIDHRVGSINVGKESRIMVIDKLSNNMWGSKNPIASVVRRARPSDILAVF